MRETLLQKALKIKRKKFATTKEEAECCAAFVNGQIGWKQLTSVVRHIGDKNSVNYGRISKILRDSVEKGWVKVKFTN